MIKFFRNIRKRLLGENRFSKYLIYAVGEIILVVIGILIALQINNLNQKKQRLTQEKVLLEQLRDELLEVYEDVYADYALLGRGEQSHFQILEAIEKDLKYADTMAFDFYFLKEEEYIYPNTAVYERIKDLGLDIIKNDSLRHNIQLLYDHIYPRISKSNSFTRNISEYLDPYYEHHFRPNNNYEVRLSIPASKDSLSGRVYSTRSFSYPQEFNIQNIKRNYNLGYIPNDFEALKKDSRFLMLLEEVDANRNLKLARYAEAREKIKSMVNTIDQILKDD